MQQQLRAQALEVEQLRAKVTGLQEELRVQKILVDTRSGPKHQVQSGEEEEEEEDADAGDDKVEEGMSRPVRVCT